MLGIYRGCPAVFCPVTGACVLVFANTARGWSRAIAIVRDVRGAGYRQDVPVTRPVCLPGKTR